MQLGAKRAACGILLLVGALLVATDHGRESSWWLPLGYSGGDSSGGAPEFASLQEIYDDAAVDLARSQRTSPGLLVPDVVVQIWLGGMPIRNFSVLSALSVHFVQRPRAFVLIIDEVPLTESHEERIAWQCVQSLAHIVQRNTSDILPPRWNESHFLHVAKKAVGAPNVYRADILRLEVLQKYGGIYLDGDVILLKPLTSLRSHNFTMGFDRYQGIDKLNNGVMLSSRDSRFARLFYDSWEHWEWNGPQDHHGCEVPYRLAKKHPKLVYTSYNEIPTLTLEAGSPRVMQEQIEKVLRAPRAGCLSLRVLSDYCTNCAAQYWPINTCAVVCLSFLSVGQV